jgi:hypothetical protein
VQARRMKELGVVSSTDLEVPSDITEALRDSRSGLPAIESDSSRELPPSSTE